MSEIDEWEKVLIGDGEAFGRIFDIHKERVYKHAYRFTKNPYDAEDVTAAAFLELWRRRKDVRIVENSILPWLLATTTNLSLNVARGLRRYRNFLARLPREERIAQSADETVFENASIDINPNMKRRISELKLIDQQLLVLIVFEDFPLGVAAEALGLTEPAARSRWQRIRRGLSDKETKKMQTIQLGESK